MTEYTYKDVIIDPEDPRVEIGKKYYSGIVSNDVLNFANHNEELVKLIEVEPGTKYPFHIKSDGCDCWTCLLIRKKEPEKKYVPFDLSDPEVRKILRGMWIRRKDDSEEKMLWWFWKANGYWMADEDIRADELLRDWIFDDNTPCGKLVEVEE